MRWHSLEEPVSKTEYTNNTYCLVKYKDCCGYDHISDCLYRDGKFIDLDKIIPEELNEVIAWCSFKEIEEYINLHNLWRNRDDECDYFNNLRIVVSTTDDGESVVTIPAIGKMINGERRFYELYEDGLPVGVVYGWVEIGDIWTILDRG